MPTANGSYQNWLNTEQNSELLKQFRYDFQNNAFVLQSHQLNNLAAFVVLQKMIKRKKQLLRT